MYILEGAVQYLGINMLVIPGENTETFPCVFITVQSHTLTRNKKWDVKQYIKYRRNWINY